MYFFETLKSLLSLKLRVNTSGIKWWNNTYKQEKTLNDKEKSKKALSDWHETLPSN